MGGYGLEIAPTDPLPVSRPQTRSRLSTSDWSNFGLRVFVLLSSAPQRQKSAGGLDWHQCIKR